MAILTVKPPFSGFPVGLSYLKHNLGHRPSPGWAGGMWGLVTLASAKIASNFVCLAFHLLLFVFEGYLDPLHCEYIIWTDCSLLFSVCVCVWGGAGGVGCGAHVFSGEEFMCEDMPAFSIGIACYNCSGWTQFTLKSFTSLIPWGKKCH